MPKLPFVPATEADRTQWLKNYHTKLPVQGPICGLSAAEITETQNEINCMVWVTQTWNPAIQLQAQGATAFKSMVASGSGSTPLTLPAAVNFAEPPPMCRPGVMPRLLNQIAHMKTSSGYTEAIGHDLGIIGTANTVEYGVPDISAEVQQGIGQQVVALSYTKHGHGGVYIESRRNGGNWEFLGINVVKPYIDSRPLQQAGVPETRDFQMRYWDKGEPNGEFSPVARVTVSA